jgi:hypothetical protein
MMTKLVATAIACVGAVATDAYTPSQDVGVADHALRAFIEQTDREWPGESDQQAITVDSLVLLANAVASLARQKGIHVRLADDVAQLRVNIRGYQAGLPEDERQSARLRRTLVHASGLIQRLLAEANQERRPSDPALNALGRAAESLDVDQSLRRQPDVIERFFGQAAAILQRLDQQQPRPREV